MNIVSIPQRLRTLVVVAIAVATLAIAAVSYVDIGVDTHGSANNDNGSLYLAGPINDDGGGG